MYGRIETNNLPSNAGNGGIQTLKPYLKKKKNLCKSCTMQSVAMLFCISRLGVKALVQAAASICYFPLQTAI